MNAEEKRQLAAKQFEQKAKKIHGDKYDYSLVEYKNNSTKVKIKCKKDNYIFEQTPHNHLSGKNGCPFCSPNPRYNQETFIEKCKKIHGDKYDYSKTKFIGIKENITVNCPKHGDFKLSADKHINRKQGCPVCNERKYNQETFIEKCKKIHGDKYDYSKTKFTDVRDKITIICPIHGEFKQRAGKHLEGQGCTHCHKSTEEFKNEILNINESIEILSDYRDVKTRVKVKCLKCGCESERFPSDLLKGYGCYFCNSSVLEKFTEKWLIKNNIKYEREKTFEDCKDKSVLPFDFFLKDKNILIECQGKQHYIWQKGLQPTYHHFLLQKHHDWLKRKFCIDNNIKLIYINYWDFSSWQNNKIGEILEKEI